MTRFAIKRIDGTDVTPLGNLIKGDALHVLVEARDAMTRIEKQSRLAYRRAFERGKQDGVAAGEQQAAALMTGTLAAAQKYWRTSERRLVGIVVDAVRRIIGEFDNSEIVAGMVGSLIGEARDEGKIRLFVSPDHRDEVESRVREICDLYPDIEPTEVIEDAAIEAHACRIETEFGVVETSVESQIESLRLALEKYFGTPGPVGE